MCLSIIISILAVIGMIVSIILDLKIFKIPLYFIITSLFAIILILTKCIPMTRVEKALFSHSAVNPIKILVLFISMTMLSIFLDEVGFFKVLANYTLKKSGKSQIRLFVLMYLTVSVLTIFTSNDIIVLTFTPFICYFCKNAKINPLPYLLEEFVASNTFSMMLLIGNPTNIYLSLLEGITFTKYLSIMWLPSLLGGTVAFIILYLLFRKDLKTPMNIQIEKVERNNPLMYIGLSLLVICTLLLAVADFIKIQMWLVALCFAIALFFIIFVYKLIKREYKGELVRTLKRVPYGLIPFLISMFIIVSSLDYNGVTLKICKLLQNGNSVFTYGIASTLGSNVLNNIPMSVLFGDLIDISGGGLGKIFASIIGSNLGAYLTPVGALAGIMWLHILSTQNVKISCLQFLKFGVIVCVPTCLFSLLGLYVII